MKLVREMLRELLGKLRRVWRTEGLERFLNGNLGNFNMAEQRTQEFDYVIAGFGETAQDAMRDAEERLPHPLREPDKYGGFHVGNPTEVEGDQFKVEIGYNLPSPEGTRKKTRRKSGSFGPTDTFAATRGLV